MIMIRIRSIFEGKIFFIRKKKKICFDFLARNRAIGFDEESVDHVLMLSTEDILSTK